MIKFVNAFKKAILLALIFTVTSVVYAASPQGYYDKASGTVGYELKTKLHDIIKDHTARSYSQLWTDMQLTDTDTIYENDGTVLDMYSENPTAEDDYNFAWNYNKCGNYHVEGDCYNREHSFPKSWFHDKSPMYTDLHHLYPTDGKVNGIRGNYPFGEVGNPTWTSQNGSKLGQNSTPGYSGTVFEPIDEFKGDFARTYFYMATRYQDVVDNWSSDILDGSNKQVYKDWFLSILLK